VQGDNRAYIDVEYMPEGVILKDPGRLGGNDCEDILIHWRTQQDKGEMAFRFTHIPIAGDPDIMEATYLTPGEPPDLPSQMAHRGLRDVKSRGKRRAQSGNETSSDNESNESEVQIKAPLAKKRTKRATSGIPSAVGSEDSGNANGEQDLSRKSRSAQRKPTMSETDESNLSNQHGRHAKPTKKRVQIIESEDEQDAAPTGWIQEFEQHQLSKTRQRASSQLPTPSVTTADSRGGSEQAEEVPASKTNDNATRPKPRPTFRGTYTGGKSLTTINEATLREPVGFPAQHSLPMGRPITLIGPTVIPSTVIQPTALPSTSIQPTELPSTIIEPTVLPMTLRGPTASPVRVGIPTASIRVPSVLPEQPIPPSVNPATSNLPTEMPGSDLNPTVNPSLH